MVLPRFWWLLMATTLGQLFYFCVFFILRCRLKNVQEIPVAAQAAFWGGGICGFVYGFVQSDCLLVVGQAGLIFIAVRMNQWK